MHRGRPLLVTGLALAAWLAGAAACNTGPGEPPPPAGPHAIDKGWHQVRGRRVYRYSNTPATADGFEAVRRE